MRFEEWATCGLSRIFALTLRLALPAIVVARHTHARITHTHTQRAQTLSHIRTQNGSQRGHSLIRSAQSLRCDNENLAPLYSQPPSLPLHRSLSPFLPVFLSRLHLQLVKGIRIGEHLASQPPDLLGRLLEGTGGLALEHVQAGQEVVGTASVLQAGDQLQKDPIEAVGNAALVPLKVTRMLLALVEQQILQVIRADRIPRQLQVTVTQRLQYAQAAATAATFEAEAQAQADCKDSNPSPPPLPSSQ